MKKILIAVAMLTAAALAIFIFKAKKSEEKIEYKEVVLQRGSISLEVATNGTVNPRNRLEIKPPISGRIDRIMLNEGERVIKGEVVAWMSSTERAALLDTARTKGEDEASKWADVYKPTPIIAPLDGFIIRRKTEPGQTVTSQDAILVMADDLIVKAQVDETDIGKLEVGQGAVITLDAYPDQQIKGRVEHIAYESEVINNVTIYQVDIRPLEKLKMLRSGMSADIDIVVKEKKNALLLPSYAVIDSKRGKMVIVKAASGEPERKKIQVGIDGGEMVEVTGGVEEDDVILVSSSYAGDSRFRRFGGLPGMGGRGR